MMKANRILIGFGVLVVLAVIAFAVTREEPPPEFKSPLEPVDPGELDRIEITRPGEEGDHTALEKRGGAWRVVEPVDAIAGERAVENALTKIGELILMDEASRSAANHESLGVDEDHALRVQAKVGDETVIDILIGDLKGGFTMVRLPGNDTTYRVSGSIRHVFNKETKNWRDKTIFDFQAEDFTRVEFHSPNGDWVFNRGEGDWIIEGDPIENYDSHKVSSLVTSLSRLRAMDFEDSKAPAEVGLGEDAPYARFTVQGEENPFTLRVGGSFPYNNTERFYVQRDGVEQIYVVSKYLADRFRPGVDRFQAGARRPAKRSKSPSGDTARPSEQSAGKGLGKLPPDVMRQVERELEKQKRMKAMMENR